MTMLAMKHLLRGIAATLLLGFANLAVAGQPARRCRAIRSTSCRCR